MTRAELAEALEVERFTPSPRPVETLTARPPAVEPWTPEQQAEHRAALADSIGTDLHVVEWRDAS